ncbi:hypothetical protein BSKO_07673 [Bryopsis sp. KO-2023]|nr:hypothetical protein BSKO_07673 [Bryopsis sp. KO-2023]
MGVKRKEFNTAQKHRARRHDAPPQKHRKIGERCINKKTQRTFAFPPWRMMTSATRFRPLACSAIESSVEKALLSRDWGRAGCLLNAVFNFSFLENESAQEVIIEERKFGRFHRAFRFLLEVFYHFPRGDAAVKSLLDLGMREKRYPYRVTIIETECRLLRCFILCCEGKLQDAEACALIGEKQLILLKGLLKTVKDGKCGHHTCYIRGAVAYARWVSEVREIGGGEGKELNPVGVSPIDFQHSDWVSSDMECSRLANELRGQLENAKDLIKIPSMDSFYKLAHLYAVQGEWDAAVAVGNKACKSRPLDADSHTLSACLSLGSSETSQTKALATSKLLVELLKCDPACKRAAHTLVEFSTKWGNDWSVKASVVEGLLYHLDVCPPRSQYRRRPGMQNAPENGMQAWTALSETLIEFSSPVNDTAVDCTRIEHWGRVRFVLCSREAWWKKFIFKVQKPFAPPVDLESMVDAGFLASVAVCSVFVLGKDNEYCKEACELLVREDWPKKVERIELAKKNVGMEVAVV